MAGAASWSVADVVRWVERQSFDGADALAQQFRGEEINGEALLAYAGGGRKELKEDFGMSIGKATALLKGIRELAVAAEPSLASLSTPNSSPPQTVASTEGSPADRSPAGARGAAGGRVARTEEGIPPDDLRATPLQLEVQQTSPSSDKRSDQLRAELSAMKLSQLRKRAAGDGVDEEAMEAAADGDSEKAELIDLIVQTNASAAEAAAGLAELRAELSDLKLSQLRKRAAAGGIDEEAMEEAADGDDEKTTLIDLLLALRAPPPTRELDTQVLRRELSAMKLSQLRKQAAADGVDEEAMEDAADGDDERAALIELMVQKEAIVKEAAAADERSRPSTSDGKEPLRAELRSMKQLALNKRATAAGVTDQDLEAAEDTDDYKSAVIELIISQEVTSSGGNSTEEIALRGELSKMKQLALNKRASAAGVTDQQLEDAEDTEDYRNAVIELIIQKESSKPPLVHAQSTLDVLRAELTALRLKELRTRAKTEGVSADLLEDAMDDDDPKAAVIKLLLDVRAAAEATRSALSGLRLKELRARAKEAGHSADLLEEAADSDEPKAAVIELLLSPAPRAATQPEPEPEPELAPSPAPSAMKATDQSEHPVYRVLESHQLEQHFDKLISLGVKRVEDLEQLSQADVNELEMKKFDRAKFMSAFLTETPHHSAPSAKGTVATTAGGFIFEGEKHCMLSCEYGIAV
jgi:hypothetical protein